MVLDYNYTPFNYNFTFLSSLATIIVLSVITDIMSEVTDFQSKSVDVVRLQSKNYKAILGFVIQGRQNVMHWNL